MASKKLGNLIKEARTGAGLTQEQLARRIAGVSASDISQAERGLKDLTQEQLKLLRGEEYFAEEVLTNILEEVTDIFTGK